MTQREIYERQYNNARANLLVAILLTIVNVVMLLTGSDSMMLFSISFPYLMVVYSAMLGNPVLLVLAVVSLAAYFISWLLSKKRSGWLTAALVFMILDTLMLGGLYLLAEEASGIMDVLFHVWIVYYLVTGFRAGGKLKKLPPEEPVQPGELENSTPLRRVEEGEKCRILLETVYGSYRICYRRVKKTNQIVINDYIYDELEMAVEPPHRIVAVVDGHIFEVGNANSRSYAKVDGNLLASKMRWF